MRRLLLFLSFFYCLSAYCYDISELSRTIDSLHYYAADFTSEIQQEHADLVRSKKVTEQIRVSARLSDLYLIQEPDSAYYFMCQARDIARENGRDSVCNILTLRTLSRMPLTGMAAEARRSFESIERPDSAEHLYKVYCLEGMRLYLNILKLYPAGAEYDSISQLARKMGEAFLSTPGLSDLERVGVEAVVYSLNGDYDQAAAASLELLPHVANDWQASHYYGRQVLEYYRGKVGRREQYLEQLFSLGQLMMRKGMVDGALMAEVGDALYELNYPELARKCYQSALYAQSLEPSRFREHEQVRQIHDQRYEKLNDGGFYNGLAGWLLIGLCVLLAVVAVVFIYLYIKARGSGAEEPQNSRSGNKMAELSFDILNRTRGFNKLIDRKLTAGQAHELYSDIHSGRLMKEISDGFFDEFDSIFLQIEPDFISRLNTLLQPDKQFDISPDGRLSPELRIAALIKLGIDDSNKLSNVLGLSLNTIYTYRNRLRGRAKDRNTFEAALISL